MDEHEAKGSTGATGVTQAEQAGAASAAGVADAGREPVEGDGEPLGPREVLREALVDAEDPRFPWWLPLPGVVAAFAWAAFEAVSLGADFLPALLWPGAAVVALVTLVTWFGWQLDID